MFFVCFFKERVLNKAMIFTFIVNFLNKTSFVLKFKKKIIRVSFD